MALPPVLDDENLYKFRTKICERYVKQGKCEFADKCQYSHDLRWTRRPPWKYTYSPELCRDLVFVTDGRGRTIAKSNCKQKRNCRFAHTKEEQMYHPKVYKTAMCHQFKENAWCDRYYCPFAHSEAELRAVEQGDESRKMFSKPAVQEALCPDIYLPSDRPHPRLRARFLAIMDGIPSQSHLHLALDPNYLSNAGGTRTRQPYTDFISSHTPHSVLSEGSPATHTFPHQNGAAPINKAVDASGNLGENVMGSKSARDSTQQNPISRQHAANAGERRNQRTATRLVQLLQGKEYAGNNNGDAAKPIPSSSLQSQTYQQTGHPEGPRGVFGLSLAGVNDVPPYASGYPSTHSVASAQQWTSMPGSPSANRAHVVQADFPRAEVFPGTHAIFSSPIGTGVRPPVVQEGDQRSNATMPFPGVGGPALAAISGIASHNVGGVNPVVGRTEAWPGHQAGKPPGGPLQAGTLPSCSTWRNVDCYSTEASAAGGAKPCTANGFRVKCLTGDVCYWNEPIGRSRDDPSVLVYAGLILGPGKTREVVAVKQLPVVVSHRAGELWREVERFITIGDPHLVNIKRALFLPGEADEGTSLWVITEKCQGNIIDLFPAGTVPPSFLQAAFPTTGLNGLLHHILRAIQILHHQSNSAHMRIHPGNIMIGPHGEVKLGDCAGKVRYLSILDLLHAGMQGATNAKALLQWILGTPRETCWMAPEFLTSLLDLDEELSQAMWQCSRFAEDGKSEQAFAAVARNFRWPFDFLKRADAWSAGATLFYIASGGFHPYGNANDPMILANILSGKTLHFNKLNNCPWLADLLAGLLCQKASQRLTITQALHHPLFWTAEDIEKYLEDLRAALEHPRSKESAQLQNALSYNINWVESLAYIPSPVPLLPLLLSYMAMPSASAQLLAAHPHQTASSFLLFLSCIPGDRRIALVERRLIVSECLMAHAAPFLHSVYLFLFPRLTNLEATGTECPGNFDISHLAGQGWNPLALPNSEEPQLLSGSPGDVFKNSLQFTHTTVPPAHSEGLNTHSSLSQSLFCQNVTGCPLDASANKRAVPPPPKAPDANGPIFKKPNPTWGEDARLELGKGQKHREFLSNLLHANSDLHPGNVTRQDALTHARSAAPADCTTDSGPQAGFVATTIHVQTQALIQEAAGLRQQQRPNSLRGPQETTIADRGARPEGSPTSTGRFPREGTKANKLDTKHRSSGVARESRWPCGSERLAGAKQQNVLRQAATEKGASQWGSSSATVTRAPHASKAAQADVGPPQPKPLHLSEAKGGPAAGTCSDPQRLSDKIQNENTSTACPPLPECPEGTAKSSRVFQGSSIASKAYGDDGLGLRKGLTGGHTEIKFSFGASSALLQMPVAVSTVSTALSSATASDFCHGQSQRIDGTCDVGQWRSEPQPSMEALAKDAEKPQDVNRPERHEESGVPLETKDPETAKQVLGSDAPCQAKRHTENLRRESTNACFIQ